MLEVMNSGTTELSRSGGDNRMLLNCWEKPSPLIKELEQTVNFAERKCGDLMQQLNFYKEYYEKWAQTERVNYVNVFPKKKMKKCCRQQPEVESSSENEFEKVNQYFYKKIKSKITEMNNEITEANRKICSKNESSTPRGKDSSLNSFLPEEEDRGREEPPKVVENKSSKSEPVVGLTKEESQPTSRRAERKVIKVSQKQSSKSVPTRNKSSKRDLGPVKRRYSGLQRYKIRSKSLPQGVRRKFGFGGFIEVFDPHFVSMESVNSRISLKAESFKSWKSRKSLAKSKTRSAEPNKTRRNTPKSSRSLRHRLSKSKSDIRSNVHSYRNLFSKNAGVRCEKPPPKNNESQQSKVSQTVPKKEGKETNSCKAIVPSSNSEESDSKLEINFHQNLSHLIAKPNALVPFLRHPIPFIPCSSTSKSFNLGLNVQQVLSLIKHKRHTITLQTIVKNGMQATRAITDKPEPTVNTLFISQTTTSHNQVTSTICPAREGSEDSFSVITDNCRSKCSILKQIQTTRSQAIENKMELTGTEEKVEERIEIKKYERPEDVWVVEQPDPRNAKKVSSRCTCFPSKHCVDYHKVLRQYTGWRLPAGKNGCFSSDTSSYHPMITCTKSKLYAIPSQENIVENDGRVELMKVHNDLLNLNRKYSSLQELISQNSLDDYEANAELDAMESELAIREVEFKDILNFYNQLMVLKEKLKSLRVKNGQSQSGTQQPQYQRPKKDPLRPTPSMALTKVLRKIQGLQDKIKLIDAP